MCDPGWKYQEEEKEEETERWGDVRVTTDQQEDSAHHTCLNAKHCGSLRMDCMNAGRRGCLFFIYILFFSCKYPNRKPVCNFKIKVKVFSVSSSQISLLWKQQENTDWQTTGHVSLLSRSTSSLCWHDDSVTSNESRLNPSVLTWTRRFHYSSSGPTPLNWHFITKLQQLDHLPLDAPPSDFHKSL